MSLSDRLRGALLASAALVALLPGEASAGIASVSGSTLTYVAGPGEVNVVQLRFGMTPGTFTFSEAQIQISPGPGCTPGLSATSVVCDGSGVSGAAISVGDANDDVYVPDDVPLPLIIDMASGNDYGAVSGNIPEARMQGGPGDDYLISQQAGAHHLTGGSGGDQVLLSSAGSGRKVLLGGSGNDCVTLPKRFGAKNGTQRALGGGGNDFLLAQRDGTRDVVDGGPGIDTLFRPLDPKDVVRGIERIKDINSAFERRCPGVT